MQAQTQSQHHDVIAEYADMASARRAIDALEFAGLDARQIRLEGKRAHEAAEKTPKNTTTRDGGLIRHVAFRSLNGAFLGAVAGAIFGVIIGNFGIDALGSSVSATTTVWGVGGLIVGALVGAYSGLTIGDAWELTFESARSGAVVVAVHADTEDAVNRAADILTKHQALRVSKA